MTNNKYARRRKSALCQRLRNYYCTSSRLPRAETRRGQALLQTDARRMARNYGCAWASRKNPCRRQRSLMGR